MVLVLWNWLISASKNLHFVSLQVCCHQSFGLHYASQPQFFPLALHFTCTERLRRNNLLPAPPHESTVSTGGLVPSSREPSSPERLREWRQGLQYHRSRGAPRPTRRRKQLQGTRQRNHSSGADGEGGKAANKG